MFEIEKDVPIPVIKGKYPWEKMEVGDSFLVPLKGGKRVTMQSIASVQGKRMNPQRRFTTRYDREKDAVRIWRTE